MDGHKKHMQLRPGVAPTQRRVLLALGLMLSGFAMIVGSAIAELWMA